MHASVCLATERLAVLSQRVITERFFVDPTQRYVICTE